jgi:uncharacterized peroxidase-related enzyme
LPWIETIDEGAANGDLNEIYDGVRSKRGKVSNIMKVQSLNPKAMKSHMDLYLALMFGRSGLSREEREILATAISKYNGCGYCQHHHGVSLNKYWKDDARLKSFMDDVEAGGLSQRAKAMLAYADKVTRNPEAMVEDDVITLRDNGFTDEDILNINMITSYFNFVNRIAVGLGVEFTEEETRGYKE